MRRYHWLFIGLTSIVLTVGIMTSNDVNIVESGSNITDSNTEIKVQSPSKPSTKDSYKNLQSQYSQPDLISTSHTSSIERLKAKSNKTDLHQSVITEHKNFRRYPPANHRFKHPEQDPITQRYAVDERSTINKDHTFGLTIWSDQKFYLQDDVVNVYAFVQNKQGHYIQTRYDAVLIFNDQTIKSVEFYDDDLDGIYQGSIDFSQIQSGSIQPGIYKVLISTPQQNITDAITFTLSQPNIGLTGEIKDYINDDGHLTVEVEVNVTNSHAFYFQASLYSLTGVPVGVTQSSHNLTKGKHWIPFTYSGLLIRDSNESGPYVLQQLSLAKITMPMQRAPLLFPQYQTESYRLDEFSDKSFE